MSPAKLAVVLLQKKRGEKAADEESDSMAPPALEEVLSELKDAMDAGDMKEAAKSFRAAMSLCDEPDAEESEDY